ncbi:MAG: SCO family protein [Reichenbachiella sp.]
MIKTFHLILLLLVSVIAFQCSTTKSNNQLPILGRPEIKAVKSGNDIKYDTIPHTIAKFALLNQDSVLIINDSLLGKVYVADFFFTSCPTICPVMKKQLIRVYDEYSSVENFKIISHTIDPNYDNVEVLNQYGEALGVSSKTWMFLTGDQNEIYALGEKSYMVTSGQDEEAPGGFIHSGAFLLVDTKQRIRGVYDGTMPEQVDLLIQDIDKLINESTR